MREALEQPWLETARVCEESLGCLITKLGDGAAACLFFLLAALLPGLGASGPLGLGAHTHRVRC